MKTETKKLPKSQLEITFELTPEEFKEHMAHAVEHLKSHVKVDGFRPGKAPASMVEDKIKPEALLMEAGDHAVQHVYSEYIKDNNIEAVGHPEVSIIKIALGSPFIFKAVITVLPEVELPDYKEIAKKVKGKEISVTDEEIQDSLNYLQKSRAKFTVKNPSTGSGRGDFVEIKYSYKIKDIHPHTNLGVDGGTTTSKSEAASPADGGNTNSSDGIGVGVNGGKEVDDKFILGEGGFMQGFEDNIVGMKAGEEKTFTVKFSDTTPQKNLAGKDGEFKVKVISVQKMELPEVNDEFAKQLGALDTLVALKTSMKEGILIEKTEAEKQRKRVEILEKIAEKSKFEMPEAMVEHEKQRLLEDLKNRISQSVKISFEEYLASIKKTEQEIKETYQKEAEKRLRGFLVLKELGKKENVHVSDAEVEEEINKNLKIEKFKNLNEFDINELKEYTKGVMMNEKIFQLLEKFSR